MQFLYSYVVNLKEEFFQAWKNVQVVTETPMHVCAKQ